jgi:hypothetical protein
MGDLLESLIWGAKSGQYCVIGGGSLQCSCLKSILGRSPKEKESIEDPLKLVTWLGGVHVALRVKVQNTIAAYGYVSVAVFVLA